MSIDVDKERWLRSRPTLASRDQRDCDSQVYEGKVS